MKKAFVFDFDDTLATTTARIRVMNNHGLVTNVQPRDFANFKLKQDEWFDFTEFRDNKLIQEANPTWLMDLAQEVDEEGHDVYILTAREDNSADAIAGFLSAFGVHPKTISCVGGTRESIPKRKHDFLFMLIQQYDKIYFYDDSADNIEQAPNHENFRKYKI